MAKKAGVEAAAKQVGMSVDQLLAHHLKKAEEHLIEAVKLFARKHPPDRHPEYVARLTRTQEMTTWLRREELIRIRGPIKITAAISKRKK